jgi:ribosomal protein S30
MLVFSIPPTVKAWLRGKTCAPPVKALQHFDLGRLSKARKARSQTIYCQTRATKCFAPGRRRQRYDPIIADTAIKRERG